MANPIITIPTFQSVQDFQSQVVSASTVPPNGPYPASLLISRAWNLSGIVAKEFEEVNGTEGSEGLFLLNELLAYKATDKKLIPYYQYVQFTLNPGQETYYIPNLIDVETFTFNIGDVRFPTFPSPRHHYFGDGRVDSIQSLPFEWRFERQFDGCYFYVYFLPQQTFTAHINGKFALSSVELGTNLLSVYDMFYVTYLRYALAEYMALEYDIQFAPEKVKMKQQMEQKLQWVSPPDFSMKKISFMNRNAPFNWAHVNISPAWNVS